MPPCYFMSVAEKKKKNGQKMSKNCPALPYVLIKKFLSVPCKLNFNWVVTLLFFSFFVSVTSLQMESGYSKEIFVDQEAVKKYNCEICKNVLKDAIQIQWKAYARRACKECYKQKLK